VPYRKKYSPLHEVVQLIAGRLALADREKYADAAAAVEDARMQLLEALFEGAVHAEGVGADPTEPPAYEPPSIEYDNWVPIGRGVWLHERCEKGEDVYRLDAISVYWNDDYIDYFNSDGGWAEYIDWKIRLLCDDIDREFPAPDAVAASGAPSVAPEKRTYRTGLPGRPSSKHLASQEMHRRAKEGTLCSGLTAEMRELCRWLEREHPDAPRAKPKALAATLRHEYWALNRGMGSSQ
jgi:hypothetical protein